MKKSIWDLFTPDDLAEAKVNGLVSSRMNDAGLTIYNYTNKAQVTKGAFDNPAVRQCRGLIVDFDGNIVARPLPKFWNYGQSEAPTLDLSEPCYAHDKLDGSMGVIYPTDPSCLGMGDAVATRGSFESPQAQWATEWLKGEVVRRIRGHWPALYDYRTIGYLTPIVEIVYPENRIVLDYGDRAELVLLGAMSIEAGEWFPGERGAIYLDWRGSVAKQMPAATVGEALALPPRENAEGIVLTTDSGLVKVKQEDYVRLHAVLFGLSRRSIWEAMYREHLGLEEILAPLPDEVHEWATTVFHGLWDHADYLVGDAAIALEEAQANGVERKDIARWLRENDPSVDASIVFGILDDRSWSWCFNKALKSLKPRGDEPGYRIGPSEDVA